MDGARRASAWFAALALVGFAIDGGAPVRRAGRRAAGRGEQQRVGRAVLRRSAARVHARWRELHSLDSRGFRGAPRCGRDDRSQFGRWRRNADRDRPGRSGRFNASGGLQAPRRGQRPARRRPVASGGANIPTFARVRFAEVYPGIAMDYHGTSGTLEYDFRVDPGADPSRIAVDFHGAPVRVTDAGALVVGSGADRLRQAAPVAFQPGADGRDLVDSSFSVHGDRVGFESRRLRRRRARWSSTRWCSATRRCWAAGRTARAAAATITRTRSPSTRRATRS